MCESRCELPCDPSAELATLLDFGASSASHRPLVHVVSRRPVRSGITAAGL